jgi:hypothetical protein
MSLDEAMKIVRAPGYRVSKPKPRKLPKVGPTCVVQFADGTLCRMTTHCRDDALDHGLRLCQAAWASRHQRAEEEAPAVTEMHFERDGQRIGEPVAKAAA